jgi:hypothetical protein
MKISEPTKTATPGTFSLPEQQLCEFVRHEGRDARQDSGAGRKRDRYKKAWRLNLDHGLRATRLINCILLDRT